MIFKKRISGVDFADIDLATREDNIKGPHDEVMSKYFLDESEVWAMSGSGNSNEDAILESSRLKVVDN